MRNVCDGGDIHAVLAYAHQTLHHPRTDGARDGGDILTCFFGVGKQTLHLASLHPGSDTEEALLLAFSPFGQALTPVMQVCRPCHVSCPRLGPAARHPPRPANPVWFPTNGEGVLLAHSRLALSQSHPPSLRP